MTELTVTFNGTSASAPTPKRGLSSVSITRGGDLILFDCGEGTQRQMMKAPTGLKSPRAIFITHHHGDHWLGLPGLLATIDMMETRDDRPELDIYVPTEMIEKVRATLSYTVGRPRWANLRQFDRGRTAVFNPGTSDEFYVGAFPTDHTTYSQGYIFQEPTRPGRFDPGLAIASGIQPGPDFKRLQDGESVKGLRPEDVMGPPRRGRKIVYTGDSGPTVTTVNAAEGADILIHEATFEEDAVDRARKTRHSTGTDAGSVARRATNVDRLVLTHFSPRSSPTRIVQQASVEFKPTEGAIDGKQYKVPLPA